jgi:tRNA dimethylallyltransferase
MAPRAAPLLAIVGPTASGKSELALALAEQLPIEILVADSRQVYRGMDLGTAKPTLAERARVPHHLIDLADPSERFSAAEWVAAARTLLPAIATRGRLPVVVGGTGLYVTSLVDGHEYATQARSPAVRERLDTELERSGLPALAARLARLAPEIAARVDQRNPRRVVRALERVEALGGGGEWPTADPYRGPVAIIGVARSRDVLVDRIAARARRMWTGGLLDEVRALQRAGYGPDLEPMTGHGYREAARYLAGEWSEDEALEVMIRRIRQYAKRQMTWFRRDARITWLDAAAQPASGAAIVASARAIAEELVSAIS